MTAKETLPLLPIIFDLQHVVEMDFSAGAAVRALGKSIANSGQVISFCGARPSVEDALQGVDSAPFISHANIEEAVKSLLRV